MERTGLPPPVIVEGDWRSDQTKTMKNKLQLYFQSKKKSSGGDCRVEAEDGALKATVYFRSEEVRERVLARQDHEIILENQTIKLHLISASSSMNHHDISDSSTDLRNQRSEVEPENGASAEKKDESEFVQSVAVVLSNMSDNTSRDLLHMLVENVTGLDESCYSLEVIWEKNCAVITFEKSADVEKFLAVGQSSQKLQRYGLSVRRLEAAQSVRVESHPSTVVKELLELYFEKNWALPDSVVMLPIEQAAIASFNNPKVVEKICIKQNHVMRSIPVKVYPYYESLGTALYGEERPTWKLPEPFTESVNHAVRKFILLKKLTQSINDKMCPYFCSVDMDNPEVKLSPLPSFLRQKGLTSKHVDNWKSTAQEAFRQQMSEYAAFECTVNAQAWKAAEKDLCLVVREDAVLMLDALKGILTVAGQADNIKQIRASVENIVLQTMSEVKRQTDSVSEVMIMSPAMFYILNHVGFQKAAQDISPDMKLSFDEGSQQLTIMGLLAEVFQTKAWILEKTMGMSKKQLNVSPHLLDFLKTVDPMDMSQDLFTSKGISAIYSINSEGVSLLGSSDSVLVAAESRIKTGLALQTIDVEDQNVLKLHNWVKLNQQLLESYNLLNKTTVAIQIHPEIGGKIMVVGFQDPVNEVSSTLKEFIGNYSNVQETIRVKSCAVIQFIGKKKTQAWSSIAKDNDVEVHFDSEKPKIILSGAHLHVQKVKSCFQELTSALSTDKFIVDKPGAKKYFQSQGSMFLSTIMTEFSCMVVLCPDNQEEEEDNHQGENSFCYCKVKTTSGVLVSVSKADICSFKVDAVVNAANEELKHIGGLANALLKAAGPELQKISNDHIIKNGKLCPGDVVVTSACRLPCKYVIHAVGPRFSDADRKTSVSCLKLAVQKSLTQAEVVKCATIALPAISSGVFGFPVDLCADTIAQAVREYCDSSRSQGLLAEIHLVDNNDKTVRVLARAVNRVFIDLGPTIAEPQLAGGSSTGASGGYQQSTGEGWSPSKHTKPGGDGGSGRMEQTTAEGLKIILQKGNIEDQTTDVIINTISENMNLKMGAVSKAILQAAGHGLQSAVRFKAGQSVLPYGKVVITNGFNLKCQKVFHAVCPFWNNGAGQAEEELISIIRYCLENAERLRMASLSFPAIGTGSLSFPRDVVSRVLLQEIHTYSLRQTPRYLKEVVIVIYPSDSQTVDCFTAEFKGRTNLKNTKRSEAERFKESPWPWFSQSQRPSASFSQVSSPSLGVYQMQMGQLTLQVSSGDITKEACDVIINSSNQDFSLKSGVSKAILDGAGLTVQLECANIVSSPDYQPVEFIMTSAGLLPSKQIIHVFIQNDPAHIKSLVYTVLKFCEDNRFNSVSFPALGTGQGGVDPSEVADAMVNAVVDFVRKKQPRFVRSVKILIFQRVMIAEFHRSMKRKEGEEVAEKNVLVKIKDSIKSLLGLGEERGGTDGLVLEREEFEPTVFQLCADSDTALSQAKKRVEELIVAEQAERTIRDQYISQLSQADMDQLKALQRKLTVSIRLERGLEDQEPNIHIEGLTRDVFTAESEVRDIIRKVERSESLKTKAVLLSELVEWQFEGHSGVMVSFDIFTNLTLEEALEKKRPNVKININNSKYDANVLLKKAVSADGCKEVELHRKEVKDDLPSHWDDMKGSLLQLFPLTGGSKEYNDVEMELKRTGLTVNIISIERVQNTTLWQNYQLMKKHMEAKNKHTNNERMLFHGTGASSIDLINTQGFNRSYAGTNGAVYGNGSYFAVDPIYSAQNYAKPNARGHKCMYLARVLVGDYTKGKGGLITPPPKNSGIAADLYDSVADDKNNPTMFVVFNDIQAYPEYLITFT